MTGTLTGASGIIYGVAVSHALREAGGPTHLIISESAGRNLRIEPGLTVEEVRNLADAVHPIQDIIDQSVGKVLDQFDIEHSLFRRWSEVAEHDETLEAAS